MSSHKKAAITSSKKKKGGRSISDVELSRRQPLQAILLADSFVSKFSPITLERPKVLLPLVNVPMIDYTLTWLQASGVETVFIVCCAHSAQVLDYLKDSKWCSRPNFIQTFVCHYIASVGDALRMIYEKDVISGDFVLISGDTVANVSSLRRAFLEHTERRKKDNNVVMTMFIQQSELSPISHNKEIIMGIDSVTKQLVYYDAKAPKGNPNLPLHNDKQDCYIDICSPEVLSLFNCNFDYQCLRGDLVKGLLDDDVMGYKIFTHEIPSGFVGRIDDLRSYDVISKHIIQRWKYFGNSATRLEKKEHIYKAIGERTKIGNNSRIFNSVIGSGCTIGSNVSIMNCYIWDNVTIEDGCELNYAVVCNGAIIKSGAVLEDGVILSFKVVVGPKATVPAYSKVSLLQERTAEDSDEELCDKLSALKLESGGVGFIWSISKDEWKNSIAPISADNLDSDDYDSEDSTDVFVTDNFEEEVEATIMRAVDENIEIGDVIREINCLRFLRVDDTTDPAANCAEAIDCAEAIFQTMMKLSLRMPYNSDDELRQNVAGVLNTWRELLMLYTQDVDDQILLLIKFEDMCLESTKELSPYFAMILQLLYDNDIVTEDAIWRWANETQESDKMFVKQSETFIHSLREASNKKNDTPLVI